MAKLKIKRKKKEKKKSFQSLTEKILDNKWIIFPPLGAGLLTLIVHLLGFISDTSAGFFLALIAVLFLVYAACITFLLKIKQRSIFILASVFILLWFLVTFYHLYTTVYFGELVFQKVLSTASPSFTFAPPQDRSTREHEGYITIAGVFKPTSSESPIAGDYKVVISDMDDEVIATIADRFVNEWPQKKVAHSFYALFRFEETMHIYPLKLSGKQWQVHLDDLETAFLEDGLTLQIAFKTLPSLPIAATGLIFILLALVLDYYFSEIRRRNLFSVLVSMSFVFVYVFHFIGIPKPTLKPLVEGFFAGLVGGALLAAILMLLLRPLFRTIYDPQAKFKKT